MANRSGLQTKTQPHKPEEEKKEEQHPPKKSPSGKALPQLVSLDLNLDSLKGFLEEIQEVINEHARTLAS